MYGFKNNLVKSFDQEIISELRKCYYGVFSGLIYIFSTDTTFSNIDNKVELLTWIFKDKNIKLVKGSTNSTRNILFYEYGQGHLDYNLWIEVEEGNKTWVYDLFSLLKINLEIKSSKSIEDSVKSATSPSFKSSSSPPILILINLLPIKPLVETLKILSDGMFKFFGNFNNNFAL